MRRAGFVFAILAGKPKCHKPICQQFAGDVFDFTGRRAFLFPAGLQTIAVCSSFLPCLAP